GREMRCRGVGNTAAAIGPVGRLVRETEQLIQRHTSLINRQLLAGRVILSLPHLTPGIWSHVRLKRSKSGVKIDIYIDSSLPNITTLCVENSVAPPRNTLNCNCGPDEAMRIPLHVDYTILCGLGVSDSKLYEHDSKFQESSLWLRQIRCTTTKLTWSSTQYSHKLSIFYNDDIIDNAMSLPEID
ncbi:hypothetical protein J6590_025073, partial [Homalodisca vitripennis]